MIAFASSDIGQYVYGNYLVSSLWSRNLEINLNFLIKLFFFITKKLGKNAGGTLKFHGRFTGIRMQIS